jgi:signal transduction histidine kinase
VTPSRGWAIRAGLVLLASFFIVSDLLAGVVETWSPGSVAEWIGPYLPLLALTVSAPAGLFAWTVVAVAMLASQPDVYLMAAFVFPTFIVVGLCAYRMPHRHAIGAAAAVLAWTVSVPLLSPAAGWDYVVLLTVLVLLAAAAGFGLNELRDRNERGVREVEALRQEQEQVRRGERTRLAHELHDIVAHDVTIMTMQARRAGIVQDPVKTQEILRSIGESGHQVLEDLRRLVLVLRESEHAGENGTRDDADRQADGASGPQLLGEDEVSGETTTATGLRVDLDRVAGALRDAGFTVEARQHGELELIPASLRQSLRRALREMGTNILKHADPARVVEIRLDVEPSSVSLGTRNAVGQEEPVMSSNTGLEALSTRAQLMGGELASGRDGSGRWSTRITLPLAMDGAALQGAGARERGT